MKTLHALSFSVLRPCKKWWFKRSWKQSHAIKLTSRFSGVSCLVTLFFSFHDAIDNRCLSCSIYPALVTEQIFHCHLLPRCNFHEFKFYRSRHILKRVQGAKIGEGVKNPLAQRKLFREWSKHDRLRYLFKCH